MAAELIYVYCVSQKEPALKDPGPGNNIYAISHQALYAVVGKVSEDEFSEENLKKNLADMNWIEPKAREHIKVINRIMETSTVIPFKFGTIFKTEASLRKMLEDYSRQIKDNIAELDGKEEWSVKIYCNFKVLTEKTVQISGKIKQLDREIFSSSPGKAFLLKKKRNELVKDEVNREIGEYGQCCFGKLKEQAREAVINRLLPREVTEKENEMILNIASLVSKEKAGDFHNAVEELKSKYKESGFEFDCTGPWPPYNFTAIKAEV